MNVISLALEGDFHALHSPNFCSRQVPRTSKIKQQRCKIGSSTPDWLWYYRAAIKTALEPYDDSNFT